MAKHAAQVRVRIDDATGDLVADLPDHVIEAIAERVAAKLGPREITVTEAKPDPKTRARKTAE